MEPWKTQTEQKGKAHIQRSADMQNADASIAIYNRMIRKTEWNT